jgi:hypothetical protein
MGIRILLLFALAAGPLWSQEGWGPEDPIDAGPPPPEYEKALQLQRRKRWISAKKAFRRFIKNNPDSPWVSEAELRSGDNAYLGTTVLWRGGPYERRIDVAVMGDGFTVAASDQNLEERWAKLCVDVLWSEPSFSEYRNYFNIYFVRLASFDEYVDPQLTPEQRKKIELRNKQRRTKKKVDYNTALDAKEAGPQRQVLMNRGLVFKWLEVANGELPGCSEDRFVIAFARFGKLGMGGGGVANVGRPDKSVTVHEFGHAFSRLLDEYAINPRPPSGAWLKGIRAANAATTDDPKKVPWAHFLKKRVKGVGVYEGGATFKKGVWRPAPSCAMNSAGARGFCPVCREASILVIYEHVNPIDEHSPPTTKEVKAVEGGDAVLVVVPMKPRKHRLKVDWYVAQAAARTAVQGPEEEELETDVEDDEWGFDTTEAGPYSFYPGGSRMSRDRSEYDDAPKGELSKLGKAAGGRKNPSHMFPLGKLAPGRYWITAEVRDATKWVLKDPKNLLKERATWTVTVSPKP